MDLAPIALFVYARPNETLQTLEALSKNYLAKDSDLFIFSDGAKGEKDFNQVNQVRDVVKNKSFAFKKIEVIERENNLGLANSIITGVTEVLNRCDKVIVMEEDLVSSPNFLNFVNASLSKYSDDEKIFSVTGYTYNFNIPQDYRFDNYFLPRCESLGWGTWKNRWLKADWDLKDLNDFLSDKKSLKDFSEIGNDLLSMLLKQQLGKVDSWAIRWCYAHFKNNALCSYPVKSKIIHIGEGGFATHVKSETKFLETELDYSNKVNFELSNNFIVVQMIFEQYKKIFRKSLTKQIRNCFMMYSLKKKLKLN